MMFSDKAFAIWMGHAGEDTQVFTQDAATDVTTLERTQVLAIARRDVAMDAAPSISRRQLHDCEPEAVAA